MKKKQTAIVASQREIAPMIYDMWMESDLAEQALPGQFLCVYPKNRSTLLPRPISICEVREDKSALRIVYRIAGQGTEEFSRYRQGDSIDILGTLGNGFPVEAALGGCAAGDSGSENNSLESSGKKVFLMGGGIGIPPMLQLAKELSGSAGKIPAPGRSQDYDREKPEACCVKLPQTDIQIIVGYRDNRTFLREDLERYGSVYIASEDGSVGTKGNVMDVIREKGLSADVIYACGPMPMLRAIRQYAQEEGIPAYISLEEHMACGVGACLGCVVRTKEMDHHSHVHNARICTEGPVFEAGEVEI